MDISALIAIVINLAILFLSIGTLLSGLTPLMVVIFVLSCLLLPLTITLVRKAALAEKLKTRAETLVDEAISEQRHAFGNKLQVILGLIQIGDIDRTKDYIKNLDLKALYTKHGEDKPL